MSRRVLITGGSGFIGTNLVAHHLAQGDAVCSLDIAPPRHPAHRPVWRHADLRDGAALAAAVRDFGPSVVLHFGARTDLLGRNAADYAANTEGTRHLLAALAPLPVDRVIFASSRLVCPIGYQPRDDFDTCPTTAYGVSKVVMERLIRDAALPYTWSIVRPTSIWGPWFGVPYRTFFDAVRRGLYFHPGRRPIRKSYGFVGNTVAALDRLLGADGAAVHGRLYYLADYPPLDLLAWAELIREAFAAPPIRRVPLALLKAGGWAGDGLKALGMAHPPLTRFRVANLVAEMVHDLTPLQQICGALPYALPEAVALTADWMKRHG